MLDGIKKVNFNKLNSIFMKKLIDQININSLQEAENILKSAGTEDLFEKAKHQDGDMHPNGKWVWVSSANGGKGDWRTKGGRTHTKHSTGGNAGTGSTATTSTQQKPKVVDISKIPDSEFKRITQMLEKNNPNHKDASRYLEEEAMSDKELRNFYACAEHFKNNSKINKMTQEYCKKWAELARQEIKDRTQTKPKKRPIGVGTNGPEKRNSTISLPDKMESLYSDMDEKYLSDKRPYTYTDNGFFDLNKQGAKGYGIWIGFRHKLRGRQPVNRNQLSDFVRNTAVEHLLKEVNQKTGKKYVKKDVVIEDFWDATDMFRIYIKTEE
jgi:hypothetical protein